MLVTNPKARATAEQSAFHPFLEPMDVGAMVEEEMVGISSSSETERETSLVKRSEKGSVLERSVENQEERLLELETLLAKEIQRLEAKLEHVVEAKDAGTSHMSKFQTELSFLKAEKEAEKTMGDDLRRQMGNMEIKLDKFKADKKLESERASSFEIQVAELKDVVESQQSTIEDLKQKFAQLDGMFGQTMEARDAEAEQVTLMKADVKELKSTCKKLKRKQRGGAVKKANKFLPSVMQQILKVKTDVVELKQELKEIRGLPTSSSRRSEGRTSFEAEEDESNGGRWAGGGVDNKKGHEEENCGKEANEESRNEIRSKDSVVEVGDGRCGSNLHIVKVSEKTCSESESHGDIDESYFSIPKREAAVSSPFIPRSVSVQMRKSQGLKSRVSIDSNRKEGREDVAKVQEHTTNMQDLKKARAAKGQRNDSENNAHVKTADVRMANRGRGHSEVHSGKKSLAELVQKNGKLRMEREREKKKRDGEAAMEKEEKKKRREREREDEMGRKLREKEKEVEKQRRDEARRRDEEDRERDRQKDADISQKKKSKEDDRDSEKKRDRDLKKRKEESSASEDEDRDSVKKKSKKRQDDSEDKVSFKKNGGRGEKAQVKEDRWRCGLQ